MADVLAEYAEALTDIRERFGADLGWMIAYLKEREVIPEEADHVGLSFTADSCSIFWAVGDDEWTRV